MKKLSISVFAFLFLNLAFSQQQELDKFNQQRERISNTGVNILGSYAVINVVTGVIASGSTTGSTKYFHQMNAIWNGVTLGIVAIGKLTSRKQSSLNFLSSTQQQHNAEKLFLFNAGLDLAYIAGGAYLNEKSKNTSSKPERLKGYGQSVMLQGAVLLVFDGIMYAIHNRHGKQLNKLAGRMQLVFTGNSLGLQVRL
jgi:hypothetical protein